MEDLESLEFDKLVSQWEDDGGPPAHSEDIPEPEDL